MVASSSNIFALSARLDPECLPEELRVGIHAFKGAYHAPDKPIETRHLELYSGYLQQLKQEHVPLLTEKIIRATTLTGTPQQVIESIEKMREAGVHQVAIQPILDTATTVEQVASEIMPKFA
jgi:alkanesulfonate monooxygenase SsuD/methylene tetrahydromethanopterin reductase-like flavin-dependent oxidoreductase (luciferase family)